MMVTVYPMYYPQFRCLMGACQHNCCIGWEIDIDPDTADYYAGQNGPLAEKLKRSVAWEDVPHFVLGDGERCPFLTSNNLCEIIQHEGEDSLCEICREHPRFYNDCAGRMEVGLGLSCEAAARLILLQKEPFRLVIEGDGKDMDPWFIRRNNILQIIQDRGQSLNHRILKLSKTYSLRLSAKSMTEWATFLLSLERMDESWTDYLLALQSEGDRVDMETFDAFLGERQTEYEQLLSYFLFRYLVQAETEDAFNRYLVFTITAYLLLHTLGAVCYHRNGAFTEEDQIELCRLFSAEIEYSEENVEAILNALA